MTLKLTAPLHQQIDALEKELLKHDLYFGHSTSNAYEEACWIALYASTQGMDSDIDWDLVPDAAQLKKMQSLRDSRISSKKPLAYLIKEAWFCGLRFYVDERAIVPRSYFGEWIPEQFSPWLINADKIHRALDLCTGSGCIAIALAYAFEDAQIDATELSADALAVAEVNVKQHQLSNRVHLHQADLFAGLNGQYDLICSNPPYISNQQMQSLPEEYLKEPDMAFRAGELGLDLVDIILKQAKHFLNDGGSLIVEVGTAALALEEKYPDLPFTWLSTDDEAMALFLLEKEQLP